MPRIERTARECLESIKQRLGLKPIPSETPEGAVVQAALEFLEDPSLPRAILNLTEPSEQKPSYQLTLEDPEEKFIKDAVEFLEGSSPPGSTLDL